MSQKSRLDGAAPLLAQAHAHADGKHDEKNQDNVVPDAGLRSLDHYKRALPGWRYTLRQRMLPLVRWETPYLAYLQNKVRTPALDTYFAVTANLGTHTFFMVGLPIFIWCGWPTLTRTMVHLLAGGVFFTGFVKDMCSLPRPLSPPLQRITMSGSAALEYGFPSTHSANAVSVAVYAILSLRGDHSGPHTLGDNAQFALEALAYLYALSIIVGRLYCGMHGFVDVVAGSLFGALISLAEYYYGPLLAAHMQVSGWTAPALVSLIIITLVRVHPEPADDCPCFDDSVAFAGVVIGIEIGTRRLLRSAALGPLYAGGALDLSALGLPAILARIALGVVVIFAWREVMKPALLKLLPHLFRVIERAGMSLPRRFFMPASEYKKIPPRLRVDNVMPSVSDLPRLVRSLRGGPGGRGRSASVSVGPQSAADAYETLAYRERRRRESIGSNASVRSTGSLFDLKEGAADGAAAAVTDADVNANANAAGGGQDRTGTWSQASGVSPPFYHHQQQHDSLQEAVAKYEGMMGQVPANDGPEAERATSPDYESALEGEGKEAGATAGATPGDELGEKEIFSKLVKPRVRYDVEVVTKLIVYAGIGWLSAEFMPNLFELVGLGVSHLTVA